MAKKRTTARKASKKAIEHLTLEELDAKVLHDLLTMLRKWKKMAGSYGPDSPEAKQVGGLAVEKLCRSAPLLGRCLRDFGAFPDTSSILSDAKSLATRSSDDELRTLGREDYYVFYCTDEFITDLERWQDELRQRADMGDSSKTSKDEVGERTTGVIVQAGPTGRVSTTGIGAGSPSARGRDGQMKKRDRESHKAVKAAFDEARCLRTLGDCRNAVRDPKLRQSLFHGDPEAGVYEITRAALLDIRCFVLFAGAEIPEWYYINDEGTQWKTNQAMICCIRLMEFACRYADKSLYDVLPDWPKYPDPKAIFDAGGRSYLEAAFDFVCDTGRGIIQALQEVWPQKNHVSYFSPFTFLKKTPAADDLQVSYTPNPTVKAWFNLTVERLQTGMKKYGPSRPDLEAKFSAYVKYLADEQRDWEKARANAGSLLGEAETPVTVREFMREYCKFLSSDKLLESRVTSLQSLWQKNKAIRPRHVEPWKRGQSKKYKPSTLISMWSTYKDKLLSLPDLKDSVRNPATKVSQVT